MTVNGHAYKLSKHIYSNVQTKGKGEINTAEHKYCENCILILYQFEGLKKYVFVRFYNCVLPSKNVKYIYLTLSVAICLISNPAHYLSVQNEVTANRQPGMLRCFWYISMFPTLTQLPTNIYSEKTIEGYLDIFLSLIFNTIKIN